jgi:hypothetical protein
MLTGSLLWRTGSALVKRRNRVLSEHANNQLLTTLCHAMGLDVDGVGDYSGNVDALLKRA